jgi:hypothetical protein
VICGDSSDKKGKLEIDTGRDKKMMKDSLGMKCLKKDKKSKKTKLSQKLSNSVKINQLINENCKSCQVLAKKLRKAESRIINLYLFPHQKKLHRERATPELLQRKPTELQQLSIRDQPFNLRDRPDRRETLTPELRSPRDA